MIPGVVNHLWQSMLFAAVAGLVALALRKNRARARHWIWLIASVKFLIPFSLLVGIGSHLGWRTAPAGPRLSLVMVQVSQPFSLPAQAIAVPLTGSPAASLVPAVLMAVWGCGFVAVAFSWWRRWRRIRAAVRAASPIAPEVRQGIQNRIEVLSSPALLEPGVFGICRPVLLLPEGIRNRLTPAQLEAILAHELCHARHRDNLAAAIHMVVEAIFWFYPRVWWLGARLVEERERACDEEVLRLGSDPEVYAESILKVCRFYLESPLVCMSGATGSNLKKRIEGIMTHRIAWMLDFGRKLLLAVTGIAAVAGPVAIGILNAPESRAQSQVAAQAAARPAFEVASIKPSAIRKTGGEGSARSRIEHSPNSLTMWNVGLSECVQWAYGVAFYQISGPKASDAQSYDILAKAAGPAPVSQLRLMLQELLAERFKLTLHRETKTLPVYALVVTRGGPKLRAAKVDGGVDMPLQHTVESLPRIQDGSFVFQETSMREFAEKLSLLQGIDRPVLDRTGINGFFDITLKSGASAVRQNDGSVFTLIQEQLGLKLESTKGPVEILVIDHVERVPTEN